MSPPLPAVVGTNRLPPAPRTHTTLLWGECVPVAGDDVTPKPASTMPPQALAPRSPQFARPPGRYQTRSAAIATRSTNPITALAVKKA